MANIRVAGWVNDSIVDGPGLRFTLFTQGCPHHCEGCHNPETWTFDGGQVVDSSVIINLIKANTLISGVTLSGGEPFSQAAALLDVAKYARDNHKEIAIYTGWTFEQLLLMKNNPAILELLQYADVLIDGRFELCKRSLALDFRGSSNQRILDVKKSLALGQAVLQTDARWNPSKYEAI